MTPTQIARRSDSLYADGSCGITRRVLCDMVAQRESDIEQERSDNARLRKLVRDYFNAPCLECNPWSEGWEGCKHCESGNCTLAARTLELGIEVDG